MSENILKFKELLTQNYKITEKKTYAMSNPNERSPLMIKLTSPGGEEVEFDFRNNEIDMIQGLI